MTDKGIRLALSCAIVTLALLGLARLIGTALALTLALDRAEREIAILRGSLALFAQTESDGGNETGA